MIEPARPKFSSTHAKTIFQHKSFTAALAVMSLFVAAGIVYMAASRALIPVAATEPEKGTLQSPAAAVADSTASGGQAVKFANTTPNVIIPSGEPMPVGDLTGWRQVLAENFNVNVTAGNFPGTAYSKTFSAYPDGWKDTSGNGTYMSSKVNSVSGGILDFYLRTENGVVLVAAPTPKLNQSSSPGDQLYGRYAVRFRADAVPGYKTAWLLWPASDNWEEGEIDFPEGDLTGTISGFSHCAGPNPAANCLVASTNQRFTSWHTAVTEWIPGKVTFYLDNEQIGTTTRNVPSNPMHWVLQTETVLDGAKPPPTASGHVQVDWVAAWVRNN